MFKRTSLFAGLMAAFGGSAMLLAAPVLAQQTQGDLGKVEITGSSIKRVDSEGALPVQVIRREEIARSGITSTTELVQSLSALQGGYTEGDGIGGGGGGVAEASIHGLNGDRTLVLLNGRRLVGEAGGAVDLNMIPLAAIERVEVLSDGASAIYGSDAVAGVVNFITRKNSQVGGLEFRFTNPQGHGALERNFGIAKGFGDVDSDGWNVMLSASYDKREALYAGQRKFSRTGVIDFDYGGSRYRFFNGSSRSIPGNVVVGDELRNPYLAQNGVCPPSHVQIDAACYFDYAQTVMAFPDRERKNLMANGQVKISDALTLSLDAYHSETEMSGKIAAVPGELSIDPNGPFGSYLDAVGYTGAGPATVYYRAQDLGNRTAIYKRKSDGVWLGAQGEFGGGWGYSADVGYQVTRFKEFNEGYPFGNAFNNLSATGVWNPFLLPGEQSPEAVAAANGTLTNGFYAGETSSLTSVNAKVTKDLFELPGGTAAGAFGVSYMVDEVKTTESATSQGIGGPTNDGARFGDAGAAIPYDAERKAYGVFGELLMPVTKSLELGTAVRYDNYKGIASSWNGKLSVRYQPVRELLVRGSLGTGFRAPTLRQRYRPLQTFGVTETTFDCTPEMAAIAASLGADCRPPETQYDVKTGGREDIKPEKSKQATLGLAFSPTKSLTLSADWWWVSVRDAFGEIDEQEAFGNAARYSDLWTTYRDPVTGTTYLAYNSSTTNLGKEFVSGIDFEAIGRTNIAIGTWTSALRATYMLRHDKQLLENGAYYSPLGKNDASLAEVSFRWKATFSNSIKSGPWTHALNVNYMSGYQDYPTEVDEIDANGNFTGNTREVTLAVDDYVTFDWQTGYDISKSLSVSFGIRNLLNEDPPLSLRTSGGHMLGFDYRYTNPVGRAYQAKLNYTF